MRPLPILLVALLALPLLPAAPAEPEPTAAPLPTARPAWVTEEQERALAAGEPITLGSATVVTSRIQPGAWMWSPGWCTLNFVFANADTGRLGIGTAGHCANKNDVVSILTVLRDPANPSRLIGITQRVGVVTDHLCCGIGNDFALITVDREAEHLVDPAVRVIGGPCGAYTERALGLLAMHYGHGLGLGTGGTPRVGVLEVGANHLWWSGAAIGGDSGSPVRMAGKLFPVTPGGAPAALGVLTHGSAAAGLVPTGEVFGTHMLKIFQFLGPHWTLVDDPACGG